MEANKRSPPKCCNVFAKLNPIPARIVMVTMACLALVNAYIMRQCLSPAITQMVLPRNYSADQIKNEAVCKADADFETKRANHGTYDWDQKLQSLCLGSFYIGYLLSHLPGGYLADRYGSKWVLGLGVGFTAVFTILTPLVIEAGGAYGLIGFRILMGLCEGPVYPALSVVLADWVPLKERGLLGTIVMSGAQIGTVISNCGTGWLLELYHWRWVFYVWGVVGLVWLAFFAVLCYSSPMTHPCIKEKEKQYLLQEIGDMSAHRRALPPPPIKAIVTSCPMWALIIGQIGHNWAFFTIVSYLPKYMNDVLQIQIKKNGFLSALPSLCMLIVSVTAGVIGDIIVNRKIMKITPERKMMTGIAAFGPAIFLIAASYSGCHRTAVIVNFCLALAFMGTYYCGLKLTAVDMSPNYAGFVMACTNGVGAITALVVPLIVGAMTPNTTLKEWRLVFWTSFAVLTSTGVVYCVWANSEVQPWNEPKPKDKN